MDCDCLLSCHVGTFYFVVRSNGIKAQGIIHKVVFDISYLFMFIDRCYLCYVFYNKTENFIIQKDKEAK